MTAIIQIYVHPPHQTRADRHDHRHKAPVRCKISATVLIDAAREAAGQSDRARRLFVVPNVQSVIWMSPTQAGDRIACVGERRDAISTGWP